MQYNLHACEIYTFESYIHVRRVCLKHFCNRIITYQASCEEKRVEPMSKVAREYIYIYIFNVTIININHTTILRTFLMSDEICI